MPKELTTKQKQGIASYLSSDAVKENIMNVIGEKDTQRFISSVVSAVQANPAIAECTNSSILSAALLGHSLKLPQSPQLGFFYLTPFKNTKKGVTEAQFMLSYRGMIQLAMRSGQYQKINVSEIKEGELKSYDPITEEFEFEAVTDFEKRQKLPTIGYYAYFVLTNGFKKEIYWSKEQMEQHAKKYSASYRNGWSSSIWASDFTSMAYKTLIRQLISRWGIMSIEMESGYTGDMAVIDENGNPDYVDNVADEPVRGVDPFEEKNVVDVEAVEVTQDDIPFEEGATDGTE